MNDEMTVGGLAANARSIVLSYVRAAVVFAVAAVGGGIDPTKNGAVWWSIGIGAAWAAIPAGLRAVEAVMGGWTPNGIVWRTIASFLRALVATAAMSFVGPLSGAGAAWRTFAIAVVPAALRALQQALDNTSPPPATS